MPYKDKEMANEHGRKYYRENIEKMRLQSKERAHRWRERHPTKSRDASNEWKRRNQEKNKELTKEWKKANPDKLKEHDRVWRLRHPELKKEKDKHYYQTHKDKVYETNRKWKENHPEKVREIARKQLYRRRRELGYTPLNTQFKESEGHHINSEHVVYIPKDLHNSEIHSLKNPESMKVINWKSFKYLLDEMTK